MGFPHLPNLLPDTAAMEENPADEEDSRKDRDAHRQGGHHPRRARGQQDQGRAEGVSRADHHHGEGLELLQEEVRHKASAGDARRVGGGGGEAGGWEGVHQVPAGPLLLDHLRGAQHPG